MPSQDAYFTQLKSPKTAFRIQSHRVGIYEKDLDEISSKRLSVTRDRLTYSDSAPSFNLKISGKAPVMSVNVVSPALYGVK